VAGREIDGRLCREEPRCLPSCIFGDPIGIVVGVCEPAIDGDVRVTVARVDQHGRIQFEDGRTLPASYHQFDCGYAVTAHRSQGQSVDAVVIAGETMKQELFYVAASRGRECITVVTCDKARLRESIGESGARQSASDLARRAQGVVEHGRRQDGFGVERGRQVAVALAHQAARYEETPKREPLEHTQQSQLARTVCREQPAPQRQVEPEIERGQSHGISW
jgi:hypothetical protein